MADDAPPRGSGRTLVTLLAAVAAVLAATLAWLVWRGTDEPPGCPTVDPPPACPAVDITAIAEAVSVRLAEDGYLKKSHFDTVIAELKGTLGSACCGDSSGRPPVSRIWVVFDNARLEDAPAGTPPTERLTETSHGIAISETQLDRLDGLARALDACATPDRPVRLNIHGFSSTREFVGEGGTSMEGSDDLNLNAANFRAANVVDHLTDELDAESNVEVIHDPWPTYAAIRRPFFDSPEGVERTDQELLNRAVLVEIQDAGACAVEAVGEGSDR